MRSFLIALVVLVATAASAFEIPKSTGKVTDVAGVLTTVEKAVLTRRLEHLQETTNGNPQVGVLIVSTVPEEGIEEFANQTFRAWGVGQKGADNGALLVVATESRKMRLEVGYGLEAYIPDMVAASIIDGMKPALREKRWAAAFDGAVDQIAARLPYGETAVKPKEPTASLGDVVLWVAVLPLTMLGVFWVLSGLLVRWSRPRKQSRNAYTGWDPVKDRTIQDDVTLTRASAEEIRQRHPRPTTTKKYGHSTSSSQPAAPKGWSSSGVASSSRSSDDSSSYTSAPSSYVAPSSSPSDSGGGWGGGDSGGGGASGDF